MVSPRPLWALVLVASAATQAHAQTAARSAPSVSSAEEGGPAYRSTFEGYQPFSDEKVGSWRESNDTVGRIGGWRAYAKEARQQPEQSGTAPTAAPRAPAKTQELTTDPHAGHGKQ